MAMVQRARRVVHICSINLLIAYCCFFLNLVHIAGFSCIDFGHWIMLMSCLMGSTPPPWWAIAQPRGTSCFFPRIYLRWSEYAMPCTCIKILTNCFIRFG